VAILRCPPKAVTHKIQVEPNIYVQSLRLLRWFIDRLPPNSAV